jgi:hypothetical protein
LVYVVVLFGKFARFNLTDTVLWQVPCLRRLFRQTQTTVLDGPFPRQSFVLGVLNRVY